MFIWTVPVRLAFISRARKKPNPTAKSDRTSIYFSLIKERAQNKYNYYRSHLFHYFRKFCELRYLWSLDRRDSFPSLHAPFAKGKWRILKACAGFLNLRELTTSGFFGPRNNFGGPKFALVRTSRPPWFLSGLCYLFFTFCLDEEFLWRLNLHASWICMFVGEIKVKWKIKSWN